MSDEEIWEAGGKWWKLNLDRAMACKYVFVLSPSGEIIAVKIIEGFSKEDHEIYDVEGKVSIVGSDPSAAEVESFLGKTINHKFGRNPVAYLDEDALEFV